MFLGREGRQSLFGRTIDREFGRRPVVGTRAVVGILAVPHETGDDHSIEDYVIAAGRELGETVAHQSSFFGESR